MDDIWEEVTWDYMTDFEEVCPNYPEMMQWLREHPEYADYRNDIVEFTMVWAMMG